MSKKKEMDQLSRDALMARRCGLTYGKYKAMQYEREKRQKDAGKTKRKAGRECG